MAAPVIVGVTLTAWDAGGTVTPALPSGWAAGDLLLAVVFVRNTSQTINDTSGWTTKAYSGDVSNYPVRVFAKVAASGETAPTFTSTQTTTMPTGATILAVRGWIGTVADVLAGINANTSGTAIGFPSLTVPTDSLILPGVGIGDNNPITSDPAGYTQAMYSDTLLGSDAAMAVWSGVGSDFVDPPDAGMGFSDPQRTFIVAVPPGGGDPVAGGAGTTAAAVGSGEASTTTTASGSGTTSPAVGSGRAPIDLDTFSTDFPGTALPDGWTFESRLGTGSHEVVDGAVALTIPAATFDSISTAANADNTVGVIAAAPLVGGDLDIAVQLDSDFTDKSAHGATLIARGSGGPTDTSMVRYSIYKFNSTTAWLVRVYGYTRTGGTGALVMNANFDRYMSGCPAWMRLRYLSATGTWEFLHSSDGVTWVTENSAVRAFTPEVVKVGYGQSGTVLSSGTLRVEQVVNVLARGTTDLRDAVPTRYPVVRAQFTNGDTTLPAGLVNDSRDTSTIAVTGGVIRFTNLANSDAVSTTLSTARLIWTGTRYAECGVLLRIKNPTANSATYFTPGLFYPTTTGHDMYSRGAGYGLEVQSGLVTRPIRRDNPDDGNVSMDPLASSTGLDETPYCWLRDTTYSPNIAGAATAQWVRIERVGRRVRYKRWQDGSAEPTTWDLFDGQDQVEDFPLGPEIGYGRNDMTVGASGVFDVHDLTFYELAESEPVNEGMGAASTGAASGSGQATTGTSGTGSATATPTTGSGLAAGGATGTAAATAAPTTGTGTAAAAAAGTGTGTTTPAAGSGDATVTAPQSGGTGAGTTTPASGSGTGTAGGTGSGAGTLTPTGTGPASAVVTGSGAGTTGPATGAGEATVTTPTAGATGAGTTTPATGTSAATVGGTAIGSGATTPTTGTGDGTTTTAGAGTGTTTPPTGDGSGVDPDGIVNITVTYGELRPRTLTAIPQFRTLTGTPRGRVLTTEGPRL